MDLLIKKEAEFDSDRMIKKRVAAATALLGGTARVQDVAAVLDFMESVASLVADGDLERSLAWRTFYYWFTRYYYAAKPLIESEQRRDKAVWKDLVELHQVMLKLQAKNGGSPLITDMPADLKQFLADEVALSNG